MDTITTGNVIAFLMACSERGEVEENVKFGDKDSIIDLINKIAFRREIGDVLAEGVKRAAEILNVDNGVHIKGLEPPGYDPRGLYGTALSYATSPRGACHMRAVAHRPNLVGIVDRTSPKGQAAIVKDLEDLYCIVDSLVFCRFLCLPSIGMYWNDVANLYEIVTGVKLSVEDLKDRGAKIFDLTRDFNLREGVKDENLPPIFFKPIKHYKKEFVIRKEDFEQMLQDYYRLRGWT